MSGSNNIVFATALFRNYYFISHSFGHFNHQL